MMIHDAVAVITPRKKRKRVGRGPGSGHGKTSCRGHKGQKARTGASIRIGFEGGQMPLYRRVPKRGFNNKRFRDKVFVINVHDLNGFEDGVTVNMELLKKQGILKGSFDRLKILGGGRLVRKINVEVNNISSSAMEKIKAKGGEVRLLQ